MTNKRKTLDTVVKELWDRYADDVNLLGDSINSIKVNRGTLLEASRNIGLGINAEKTKYMIMSRHPNSEPEYKDS